MTVERLSDLADPRLAAYRALADANLLQEQGCFIAEGRLVVRRLIEARRFTIKSLLVNAAAFESLQPLLASLDDRVPVFIGAPADLQAVTGHDIHRGCLALVERPTPPRLEALLDSIAPPSAADPQRTPPPRRTVLVALDRVANPDNMGGVFRNAAAFAAAAVLIGPGCSDPLYRKAIRTSMAATLQVPYAAIADWPRDLSLLRARGFTLAALSPRPPAADIDSFARSAPPAVALLVGAEGDGLAAAIEAEVDVRVRIPISNAVDSLNLAVAVGIALQRLCSALT